MTLKYARRLGKYRVILCYASGLETTEYVSEPDFAELIVARNAHRALIHAQIDDLDGVTV